MAFNRARVFADQFHTRPAPRARPKTRDDPEGPLSGASGLLQGCREFDEIFGQLQPCFLIDRISGLIRLLQTILGQCPESTGSPSLMTLQCRKPCMVAIHCLSWARLTLLAYGPTLIFGATYWRWLGYI